MSSDPAPFDPAAVRAFEHAGWQRAAAHYQATFATATREFATALLDAAAIGPEIARLPAAFRRDGWHCIPIAALLARGAKPR